ncbi:hypothetical protein A2U01_0029829, partial [Trifolium medium]|nr:hypothetical protein [Trifolium medium]
MWNSIYDTVQVFNHSELTNSPTKSSEYETIDVGPSLENVALFGVKNFNSLGHGDLLSFLENNVLQLPHELLKILGGGMCGNSSFKA